MGDEDLDSNIQNLLDLGRNEKDDEVEVAKAEEDTKYKDMTRGVLHFVLILGILTVAFMMAIPEIRAQIEGKTSGETLLFLLFELVLWVCVSWIIGGRKNLPVNYSCLVLIKCFIFYDVHFKSQLNLWKVPAWSNAGFLFVLKSFLRDSFDWEQQMAFFSPLVLIPAVTFFTNINIGDYEISSLVGTTISTALGMGILVSSMGIGEFGESWINYHFRTCVVWAYFTSVMTFFNLLFLSQRAWKYYNGKMSPERFSRNLTEMMVYGLIVFLMIHFVPIIHPQFSFENMYTLRIWEMLYEIIPSSARDVMAENFVTLKLIWELWFDNYKVFCPGLLPHTNFESTSATTTQDWISMQVK